MSVCLYKSEDPFAGRRDQWWYVDAGTTIADACGGHNVRAWIGGREVSALFIERARLKDGVEVFVEPVPEASAVLAVAAAVASGAAASAAASGAWLAFAGYTAIGLGLSIASSLIAQSQAEQQGSTSGGIDRLNALTGQSNRIASYEPIPRLFGRMRYYPPVPMTAKPYTETAGSDQYLRMLFVLNDGPMEIGGHIVGEGRDKITQDTDLDETLGQPPLRLGQTDLREFEDLQWEIGTPDQMTLYTDQVIETNPAWTTESDPGGASSDSNPTIDDNLSTVRTTEPGATGFSIDVSGNIYTIDSGGDLSKIRIEWMVEWRLSESSGSWDSGTFTQQSDGEKTSRVNFAREGLDNDGTQTYDIRLTRVSTYFSNLEGDPASSVTWNALRTLRDRRAFTVAGTVVMALKIRATDQLDGTIDKLSVLGTAVVPVYEDGEWVEKPSRSPAWAFASLMTDQANRDPIPLSDFVLQSLVEWAYEAEATGRYYDNVLDNNRTTIQRMEEISSAGRATWTIDPDTRIRIVRDTAQTVPKMVITPKNSYNYSYTLSAFSPPHAMRVRYTNAATWEPAERIVYDDGYDEGNASQFETIDAPGCTDSEQAWKHGRYVLARRRLRDIEKHAFSQDVQHFRYGRGDLLELAHDVILVGLAWGRVIDVTTNSEGQATAITCDEFCPMEAATGYGVKIQRLDGTVAVVGVVNDAPGNQKLTLAEPVDDIGYDDHFAFGEAGKETIDVKLVSITPRGERQANMVCEPAAANILDAETGDIPAPPDDITVPPSASDLPPNRPSIDDIISDETVAIRNDDGSLTWRLAVNVSANSGRTPTARIIVQARADDELRYIEREAQDGIAYFEAFRPLDTVTIRAQAIGPNGRRSAWAYVYDYTLVGRQPQAPTGVDMRVGTFEVSLDPQGGPPAAVHAFWFSTALLDPENVEDQAIRAGQGKSLTIGDLQGATTYYFYIRRINAYGVSDFIVVSATTKNEAAKYLQVISGEIRKTDLYQDLSDEIDLISGPPELQGSVAQRLQSEANDRADDIQQESEERDTAVSNALTEAKDYADSDSAAAQTVTELNAAFGGNAANALSFTVSEVNNQLAVTSRLDTLDSQYESQQSSITDLDEAFSDEQDATARRFSETQASSSANLFPYATDDYIRWYDDSERPINETLDADINNLRGQTVSVGGDCRIETGSDARVRLNVRARDEDGNFLVNAFSNYVETTGYSLASVENIEIPGAAVSVQVQFILDRAGESFEFGDVRHVRINRGPILRPYTSPSAGLDQSGRIIENNEVAISAEHGPFAEATRQVSINDGGQIATLEEQFTAQRSDLGGLQAQYTVKIDNDGRISGFGLSSEPAEDGTPSSQFIIRANTFAVGAPGVDDVFAFIIDDGSVYMREALIQNLTFTKLTDSSGNFVVDGSGRVKAEYIDAENITAGNTLAVGGRPESQIREDGDRARRITFDNDGNYEVSPARVRMGSSSGRQLSDFDGDAVQTAAERTAAWARENNTTLIDGRQIFTGDAYVDTLQIQGEAVTVPRSVFFTEAETISEDGWQRAVYMNIPFNTFVTGTSVLISFGGYLRINSNNDITAEGVRVKIDGSVVRTFDFGATPVDKWEFGTAPTGTSDDLYSNGQVLVDQPAYSFIETMGQSSSSIEVEVDLSDSGTNTPERRLENWFITVTGVKR